MQERTARPSSCTVQAPQRRRRIRTSCRASQVDRASAHNSGMSVSAVTRCARPLTVRVKTGMMPVKTSLLRQKSERALSYAHTPTRGGCDARLRESSRNAAGPRAAGVGELPRGERDIGPPSAANGCHSSRARRSFRLGTSRHPVPAASRRRSRASSRRTRIFSPCSTIPCATVDPATYKLRLTGLVNQPLAISLDEEAPAAHGAGRASSAPGTTARAGIAHGQRPLGGTSLAPF